MSAFPSSAIGLPQSLQYNLPPSLPDSCRSYSVNVAPDGITSVTGPAISSIFTASGTNGGVTAFGNFTSQMISFTLPSGMSKSVFLDPASTTVSFSMNYTISTASASTTTPVFKLIGSGSSWFDSMVTYSNNVPLETVNSYGQLANFMLQNTSNMADRYGGISIAMGTDTNSANGIDLAHAATGTYKYNFCIPLLSILGANSDKFFPIGSVNNIQIQLQTANLLPLVAWQAASAPTAGQISAGITLNEFTLNMKYIDVGDMAGALLAQTLQDGKWFIKSQTYTNSSVNIPSGSQGTQQLLLQIRNTSVKSIFHQFSTAQSGNSPNGYYDAVNPTLTSRQCQVGGNFYPNKPLNDTQRPAEAYPYFIQSLSTGGGITKALGNMVNRYMYNSIGAVASFSVSGADSTCVLPAAGVRALPAGSDSDTTAQTYVANFPNSAYYGYDLEKSAGILFQGVNTRASPPFLNLFLNTSTNATLLCNAWGLSDVILEIDTLSQQVKAYI